MNATAAGAVAAALRAQIIDGRQPDGSAIPRQEELLETFGVGVATVRSALRMLEAEGLVSVRRGSRGGAVVHTPKPDTIAWALGLVLQTEHTTLSDVGSAMTALDPVCAGFCAARSDRGTEVLPRLRELQARGAATIDDPVEFTKAGRMFHGALSQLCGNRTIGLITGAIDSLWSEQLVRWTMHSTIVRQEVPLERRRSALDTHQALIDAIEVGDVQRAQALAEGHADETNEFWLDERGHRPVTVTDLTPADRR